MNSTPQPNPLHVFLPYTTSAMTSSRDALWESLSTEMKHEVAALAAAWQSRRARQIEASMPTNSPELSDDDPTMETGSNNDSAPEPAPVHVGLTMEQAQAHFNAANGAGVACVDAYVVVPAGAGGAAVQPDPSRAAPNGGGPDPRRASERGSRGGHGRGEPNFVAERQALKPPLATHRLRSRTRTRRLRWRVGDHGPQRRQVCVLRAAKDGLAAPVGRRECRPLHFHR